MIVRLAAIVAAVVTASPLPSATPNAGAPCRTGAGPNVATAVPAPQSQADVQRAMAALQAAIAARSIPDGKIDANIDSRLPRHVRDLARAAMKRLPPPAREHVAGVAADGTFFANRWEDYQSHLQDTTPMVRLGQHTWRKPTGEVVAVPGDVGATVPRPQPQLAPPAVAAPAAPCPPPALQR